jgi:hypothetical protein
MTAFAHRRRDEALGIHLFVGRDDMTRCIVALVFSLFLLLGMMAVLTPASSAATSWGTLSRHCWLIQHDSYRLRACASIKGGVVDDQLMIRTKCRVKMLNFEPPYISMEACNLYDSPDLDLLAAAPDTKRYEVTALIERTPLVLCDPSLMYWGLMDWSFRFPDGSAGAYGLGVDWFNESACSLPT